MGFRRAGDRVLLLGTTREELSGSAWADVSHGHLGGRPPAVDFEHERRLASTLIAAGRQGMLSSAHDLADGGLAQALVESCLRRGFGASVSAPPGLDPFVFLFAESAGRVLISAAAADADRVVTLCAQAGIPVTELGEVTAAATLVVADQFELGLDRIREAWSRTLPAAMAG